MKTFCVLQVTPSKPNPDHVRFFANKKDCDFFFVTHDELNADSVQFCPNTVWAETRNIMVNRVLGQYMYYAFMDYDYDLEVHTGRQPADQVMYDLEKWQPATAAYYPGRGVYAPECTAQHRQSAEASLTSFAHVAFRLVHRSLIPWFFPMILTHDGGWTACHAFNIMEVPFWQNSVFLHGITYHNTCKVAKHSNNDDCWPNMHRLWKDMRETINWDRYALTFGSKWSRDMFSARDSDDARTIKNVCLKIIAAERPTPKRGSSDVDYMTAVSLDNIFNLNHPMYSARKVCQNAELTKIEHYHPAHA